MSYYDIDSILAEEEKLPIQFIVEAKYLGQFSPNSTDDSLHLKEGTKVDCQYWLASQLWIHSYCELLIPLQYSQQFQQKLKAGPNEIPLNSFPFYYDIGLYISNLSEDERLNNILLETFAERYKQLISKSYNWQNNQFTELNNHYCTIEKDR
eukprot:TRINITY_DN3267_c0_g1_i2.p1 TRINITY_DN3267_c0_g1~~TRINITY_DN3267_c0_g1_i2.p1  ORF type:complete len:152 (-),score=35.43 TRINITY_DN3267_c0_g1_i2:286-741(-)